MSQITPNELLSARTFRALRRGLDYIAARQSITAENIANVDTPGYKARDVDFKAQLDALDNVTASAGNPPGLAGILLTHGHMGHVTGLVHLGHEAMAARSVPVYAMPRLGEHLAANGGGQRVGESLEVLLVDAVGVGVGGPPVGDDPQPGADVQPSDKAINLVVFHDDLGGTHLLEIEVGVLAAGSEGFFQDGRIIQVWPGAGGLGGHQLGSSRV